MAAILARPDFLDQRLVFKLSGLHDDRQGESPLALPALLHDRREPRAALPAVTGAHVINHDLAHAGAPRIGGNFPDFCSGVRINRG